MQRTWPWMLSICAMTLIATPIQAGLRPLEQTLKVDLGAGTATFALSFDHQPDFHSLDLNNHPVDSFQVEVDGTWKPGARPLSHITGIVRGDEIHFGGILPIRAAGPADDSSHAGGWGGITIAIPYTISGNTISFTAPLPELGTSDGVFAYRAFTMRDGQITASAQAQSVPLPEALSAGACLLVVLATAYRCRNISPRLLYCTPRP